MEKAGTLATMYHSVPPRPLSYTFSDVLQDSMSGDRGDGTRSRTAPVSTNAPEEYAERFKSRPTTRPAVIDFNGTTVNLYPKIGLPRPNAGFSPVKSKQGQGHRFQPRTSKSLPEQPVTERSPSVTHSIHLAPLSQVKLSESDLQKRPAYRPPPHVHSTASKRKSKTPELSRFHGMRSAASSIKSRDKSTTTNSHRTVEQLQETSSNKPADVKALSVVPTDSADLEQFHLPQALSHSEDFDDLTDLPRPSKILPRRDLPWVFRFKVKKEMNALSRIMASRTNEDVFSTAGHLCSSFFRNVRQWTIAILLLSNMKILHRWRCAGVVMKWNRPLDIAKTNPMYFATSAANTPFLTGIQQQVL